MTAKIAQPAPRAYLRGASIPAPPARRYVYPPLPVEVSIRPLGRCGERVLTVRCHEQVLLDAARALEDEAFAMRELWQGSAGRPTSDDFLADAARLDDLAAGIRAGLVAAEKG